jgi:tetratricopeptide (TPR) repeat protein
LNRLADDDISTLVYHFFRKIPTHEELRIFDQRTGGNPLLVLETLHAALSQSPGIDLAKAIRSLPNAGNVYGLIQTRLEKLPPSARNLITLAAMIGREFRLDILAETLSPSDCPNMIADLEILEQNNLILPLTRVSSPAYVFIHEQFRESMLLNLSQARKQALHLVVASAIKKVDDSHHMASQLAIHLESAGKLSMAFESWLIAARYAFKLKSPREADICLKRAQNISHQLKLKLPDSAVYELYQLWSELALSESNLQTIVEISDNLQKDGSLRQSNLLLGTGLSLQAQGLLLKGQYTTSQMVLQQSIPHLQYCGNPFELSLAHLRKGQASLYSKKIQDAIIDLEKAIGSSQQGDDLPFLAIRAKAQYHLAVAHNMQGWPRLSLELGQQALENSLKGFDPATELMARATICHALLYMGQYQEAVIEAEKGLMLAEDRSNLLAAGYLYLALGRSELIMGHLDRGWDYSQTAIKLGLENEYQEVYSEACCITGDIFRILDSPLDAIKMYRLGIKGEISYFTNMDNQYRLGLLLGIGGNLEIGLELIQETLDQAKLEGIGTVSIPAEISRAYVIMVNQKDSDADQSINEVAYDLAKRGLVTMPIFPQTITAIKAIRNGDFNTAVEAAQQLIKTGEKHNSPIIRMRGLQILDQVWMASGMSVYKSQKQLLEVYNYLASQTTNPQIRPLVLARRHEVLSGK